MRKLRAHAGIFTAACMLTFIAAGNALAAPMVGMASFYKSGTRTANGEIFDPHGLTAAHPSLPFGTMVKVVNLQNGQSVVVRINDRGPRAQGRIIDVSLGAAKALNMVDRGIGRVRVEVLR